MTTFKQICFPKYRRAEEKACCLCNFFYSFFVKTASFPGDIRLENFFIIKTSV